MILCKYTTLVSLNHLGTGKLKNGRSSNCTLLSTLNGKIVNLS